MVWSICLCYFCLSTLLYVERVSTLFLNPPTYNDSGYSENPVYSVGDVLKIRWEVELLDDTPNIDLFLSSINDGFGPDSAGYEILSMHPHRSRHLPSN